MYCLEIALFWISYFLFSPWLLCWCVLFFCIMYKLQFPSVVHQTNFSIKLTIHLFLSLLLTVAEDPFSSKLFGRRPAGRARWSQSCFWSWSQMSRQFDYLVHVLVSSSSSSQQVLTSNDWYQCFSVIKPETHRSCTYLLCTHWD